MPNTRQFCDQEGNEHALVPPIVDVRDNLGTLAVHILAAKHDLASMSYEDMVRELHKITEDLHAAYDKERTAISYL